MSDIEDVDSYLLRIESVAKRMAWGFFILFLTLSLAVYLAFIVNIGLLFVWVSAFFIFAGIMQYQEYKTRKFRFKFWVEVNAVNAPSFKSMYIVFSGAILCAVTLWLLTPILTSPNDLEFQRMIFLFLILQILLLFLLIYLVSGYRMKKDEGKIIKHFHGQKEDAEKAVVSTLRSLGVRFRKTGQKWTLKMPSYEVEELGIIIQAYRMGINNVVVTIQSSNPYVASKVGEIERSIDSILGVPI